MRLPEHLAETAISDPRGVDRMITRPDDARRAPRVVHSDMHSLWISYAVVISHVRRRLRRIKIRFSTVPTAPTATTSLSQLQRFCTSSKAEDQTDHARATHYASAEIAESRRRFALQSRSGTVPEQSVTTRSEDIMPTAIEIDRAARRRVRIVELILDSVRGRGYPPTTRELASQLDVSARTIRVDLTRLVEAGAIERDPATPRGLRIREP